ncbi:DUF3099 domain-containing protein [Aeromicrobium terrae]|uniref:DUF3099 domain-containing protein n=1 Tax=Aeromicrobium terrae TaxID=2498846 RepID=A0A5C8NMP7_9ACTN|nr:DUF3099 domain-containing protein [Aeromicrobium terrae]TXL63134.1 DUF3099 domain-containing protein [Aeromicrobium terrae]
MANDRDDDQVFSITSARSGHSDDLGSREKRYAISMGIRTLCFVGAIIAWQTIGGWVPWLLLVGAVVLPYTSVVLANAGVRQRGEGDNLMKPEPYGTLGPGSPDD